MGELNDNLKSCIYCGGGQQNMNDNKNKSHFQNLGRLASIPNRNKKYPALADKVEVFQENKQIVRNSRLIICKLITTSVK